ncbi:MAG TPA: peptidylprolyl isomerase [Thermoanaerobaculia bacterium]|nr:peptidylprolyl isomerase [Thermoanaerobaculia bacterium]
MRKYRSAPTLAAAIAILVATLACQTPSTPPPAASATPEAAPAAAAPAATAAPAAPAGSPADHIKLQHILIAFAGKVPGKNITRTEAEARQLAEEVLARAKAGEDFDTLVRTYTDDAHPGIYGLSNSGVPPAAGEFSRDRMVPAFGEVGFSIAPGEIGMAVYDARKSPYGWHIIKRLE